MRSQSLSVELEYSWEVEGHVALSAEMTFYHSGRDGGSSHPRTLKLEIPELLVTRPDRSECTALTTLSA